MAIVDIPSHFYGFQRVNFGVTSTAASAALNQRFALVWQPTKSGMIDRILLRPGTVTGAVTVSVRLETVSTTGLATWAPTGTLVDPNATASGSLTSQTLTSFTLAQPISVSPSTPISVVFTTTGGTNWKAYGNTTNTTLFTTQNNLTRPTFLYWATSSYTFDPLEPQIGVRYSDGTYPPILASLAESVSTAAVPSVRVGNRLKLPYTCRVAGIWYVGSPRANQKAEMYNDTNLPGGTTLAASKTFLAFEAGHNTGSNRILFLYFDTPYTAVKNTWYKYVINYTNPVTTTYGTMSFGLNDSIPVAAIESFGYGKDISYVSESAGAWSETATQLTQSGPIITGIDDGSDGGFRSVNIRGGADQ